MKAKKLSRNYFKESWSFVKQNRNYIYFSTLIFLVFAFIGYFISPPTALESQILKIIEELTNAFKGLNLVQTISKIFFNNLSASFSALLLGIFFGIFPLVVAIINGYIVGYVANKAVSQEGILILWRLLPHGIFELPAVLISIGIGISLGTSLFRKVNFKEQFKSSMRAFLIIILPLLLIAAIIEGFLVFFLS